MIEALLFLAIIAAYLTTRLYSDKSTKRLPPASTPKGRQARMVIGVVMIALATALIVDITNSGTSHTSVRNSVTEVFMGAIIAIVFAVTRMRNGSK
jgi:heme/copper-type cytochrome/quinol oxidase subunit 3